MNPPDVAFLKSKVALLADFSEERLRELAEGSRSATFGPGEVLVHAGDEAHSLGVIMEGQVAAFAGSDGQGELLGRLGPGETFGEMALMTGDPAVADFVAEQHTRVLLLPLTLVQTRIMAEPRALQHISRTITERLKMVLRDPAKAGALTGQEDVGSLLQLKSERLETILILNCGSSSLKYSLFDTEHPENDVRRNIERVGADGYREAFATMLAAIKDKGPISVVGHRVVHGGEKFTSATLITDELLGELEALSLLAPLHNPVNLAGIREARRVFPAVPHVAVFDTAFHATLPSHAYLYGLPNELYEKHRIRRYGFHGSSHSYVALAAAQFLGRSPRALKVVSCHLGSGASICAIDHGRSADTTMGFTPNEGLIMGTRCGDIDSGVLTFLQQKEGLSPAELEELLNKKSGLLGLSGIRSDLRDVEKAADEGDAHALTAIKTFSYRIRKYIGAYIAAMGGIDVIIFTAGIGQGSAGVRAMALQGLGCMGITLDEARNRQARDGREIARISSNDSPVTVLVVPTDEERMIARETLRALSRDYLVRASEACRTEPITIEVSAHHIHLAQPDVESLFGAGHQLTKTSDLSQPGQFACQEQLSIIGPKGRIDRVRVLGPARKYTQVEIAMTEQFKLGLQPPIRESGDIEGSPGCTLEGPAGSVTFSKGVICALRHIHMTPADALRYGLKDKSTVRVRVPGDRELLFGDVRIRVDPSFALAMHLDTDEANAANLRNGTPGFIDGIQHEP